MFNKLSITFVQAAVLQSLLQICVGAPLEVTIYYETLCPYSQEFFINQFQPNFEKFGYSVKWTLIPFGHAKFERDSRGNVVHITCQHKELECRGNAIQACALQKVSDYATQIRFCSCFMINRGDCNAFLNCAHSLGIDYNMLNTCNSNGEGLNLLGYYGDIHNGVQPKITGVPALAVNGKQLTNEENAAMYSNFCKFICDHITDQKPPVCSSLPAPTTSPPSAKTTAPQ